MNAQTWWVLGFLIGAGVVVGGLLYVLFKITKWEDEDDG